jgi:hypothetical protein
MLFQALLIFSVSCDTDFNERIHYYYISGLLSPQPSTSNQRQLSFIMYNNDETSPVEFLSHLKIGGTEDFRSWMDHSMLTFAYG